MIKLFFKLAELLHSRSNSRVQVASTPGGEYWRHTHTHNQDKLRHTPTVFHTLAICAREKHKFKCALCNQTHMKQNTSAHTRLMAKCRKRICIQNVTNLFKLYRSAIKMDCINCSGVHNIVPTVPVLSFCENLM